MILNPWILGVVTGQATLLLIMTVAVVNARAIVKHWDFNSSSDRQYILEKKTYLTSATMTFSVVIQILMLVLLVMTADELSNILPGAMCATGTFSSNSFGFPLLWLDILCFFVFFIWLILNKLDNQLEAYPLIKEKYSFLMAVYPLVIIKFILLLLFSVNLNPGVITSCCGSIYNEAASGIGSLIAVIPPSVIIPILFGMVLVIILRRWRTRYSFLKGTVLRGITEVLFWSLFFLVSVATIIAFISTYIYQLPTHNCPFCFLNSDYYFIGIPIYTALFAATSAGLSRGVLSFFSEDLSIKKPLAQLQKKLGFVAQWSALLFVVLGFSPFVLYYLRTGTFI